MKIWDKFTHWLNRIYPAQTEFDSKKLVFSTSELYLAKIMKLKLESEGISTFLINKRDSSFNSFGQVELYVHRDDVIRAKYIIETPYE